MSSSVQRSATVVLTAAIVVLLVAMGVRATFGLLMQPMGLDKGFTRETFSLAFAIQNLVWVSARRCSARCRTGTARGGRSPSARSCTPSACCR